MCMNYNETSQWAADLGSGYSSIRPLGEGGMGTLYRAHKDSLDVDVVIKRVKQKFKGRMDERAEANILKTLKHKYLPRIYDVIESPSGYVYTIMDMIPGENMQNYVKTHGSVSQKLAYRWACQLCEVIAYLHSQVPPILHCDIKPSNIMITPNEDICVIDFNTSLVFQKAYWQLAQRRAMRHRNSIPVREHRPIRSRRFRLKKPCRCEDTKMRSPIRMSDPTRARPAEV